MNIYRIRNKTTGMFSKGGCDADTNHTKWSKKTGKIWTGMGPLKCHLKMYVHDSSYTQRYTNMIPAEWMVVEHVNGDWVDVQSARSLYPETKYGSPDHTMG